MRLDGLILSIRQRPRKERLFETMIQDSPYNVRLGKTHAASGTVEQSEKALAAMKERSADHINL
jgi:hypothetical protein